MQRIRPTWQQSTTPLSSYAASWAKETSPPRIVMVLCWPQTKSKKKGEMNIPRGYLTYPFQPVKWYFQEKIGKWPHQTIRTQRCRKETEEKQDRRGKRHYDWNASEPKWGLALLGITMENSRIWIMILNGTTACSSNFQIKETSQMVIIGEILRYYK